MLKFSMPWPTGGLIAEKVLNFNQFGTIATVDRSGNEWKVMLYGFKELWDIGVKNGKLPSKEQLPIFNKKQSIPKRSRLPTTKKRRRLGSTKKQLRSLGK